MRKNITTGRKIFFAVIVFFFFSSLLSPLFAKGKQEEEEIESQKKEFTLCITAFDVSALPAGQRVLGPILQRELVQDLLRIHHRVRGEEELLRYEEMEWITAVHAAADKLAKERERRDNLLYQGHPNWKYRQELKKLNEDIKKLEEEYIKVRDRKPLIEEKPLFNLLAGNTGTPATFPQPPEKGKDEAFLRNNSVDAFLQGKFRLLYGRIYAEFRIVARGSSFVYEDSAIFSSESLNSAADEIKQRFLAALVNSEMVRIAMNADPEDSQIVVNGRIVKKGELTILPPGPVTITASAVDHEGITEEVEMMEGGESERFFELKPLPMETLGVKFPGPNSTVYRGSMYMGGNPDIKEEEQTDAAMTEEEEEGEGEEDEESTIQEGDEQEAGELIAEAPPDEQAAIEQAADALTEAEESEKTAEIVEAEEGEGSEEGEEIAEAEEGEGSEEGAEIAEGDGEPEETEDPVLAEGQADFFSIIVPAGKYQYIRVDTENGLTGEAIVKGGFGADSTRIVTLEPRKLPGKEDKPVERARKKFYGAFGRFWIFLPIAFFTDGMFQAIASSYNTNGNPDLYDIGNTTYYISIGAWIASGVFLAETLIRMIIYVHTGTKESIPFKD